ncbi:hypothetical protein, partial [Pectobacterium carotovorum]|uniref:hypothetical protein n=1 Tax=Pectobacterium carotovorum TaxID=554 RepID=UPI001B803484
RYAHIPIPPSQLSRGPSSHPAKRERQAAATTRRGIVDMCRTRKARSDLDKEKGGKAAFLSNYKSDTA